MARHGTPDDDDQRTGWFQHPDVLSGSQPAPPRPLPKSPDETAKFSPVVRPNPADETQIISPVAMAQIPGWTQGMPAVQPRRDLPPPPDDVHQPTSVLGSVLPTQSIVPPKPQAPHTQPAQPSSDSVPFPGPGHNTGRRTGSRASARGRLGAGLVEVPPVPYRDPTSAVMTDPVVAENKRFCGGCGGPVGRGVDGQPGAAEGECPKCGAPFSFRPRLKSGDLLGGQYEVLGCLAYGGLGWIYLAKDHNVSDRWVVLKGLIDTGDQTAMASAVAEQRFLAEVEHANILKIYNFVQAPDPRTGTSVGYIVMEYIGGQSLRQIALEHHRAVGRAEPLPIGQVIAYGLEILPAMGYLHSVGLLYCDLKPDNVIQTDQTLKLIDLGAVRREDDWDSPLFFTLGYSAPELAERGASVASDIYTVGRTLAVLAIEFTGYTSRYVHSLPGPDDVPLFKLFDSFYRVLKRATHPDPDRRFPSAEDMAEQLTGVLREVMALGTNRPRPGVSTVFGPEPRTFGTGVQIDERGVSLTAPDPSEVVGALPVPQVDTDDPAAGVLAATVAGDLNELVEALTFAPQNSVEVRLRMLRARTELGDISRASGELEIARRLANDPHDWRLAWHRGLLELAMRRPGDARVSFEAVYDALPGEAAPKIALAISAEYQRDYFAAARFYEQVWRTDRSYVSAAFGLVRVYLAQGARAGAIEVLESVPDSSSHYVTAQVAAIKIKARADEVAKLAEPDLFDAARRLERLALDAERRTRLSVEVLEAAYGWVQAGKPGSRQAGGTVLGCDLSERDLRFGLERCYRALARLAGTPEQRHELVDRANAIRPRTLT
ncbi:serine/threonine-protein kinase [Actinocrispum wychmicini]|uniref:non-specific serine/threonine protein kinase n=1 Tax=Actinocrispum wychmicini TaxID=1213861 RepID=A0A4R2K5I2_9PSEU|nr:serine/threonine-protein kinase [Actinocrispum wychmicini]TCO65116.1 serine/threonine-protein kinase PknG [Actinocrispum wychmicini]